MDQLPASSSLTATAARSARERWWRLLIEVLIWLGLALCVAHGDVRRLTDSIPAGQEASSTVPVFNAWTIGWNARSLRRGLRDYWHAPIFFPEYGTFALSEPQPTTLLVAPLVSVDDSVALAYNAYLLFLLLANAMIGRRLLGEVGHSPLLTWCGGIMFLMLPFVVWQLGVLQLAAVCGPLALIWAVVRFAKLPTWSRSVACGLAFAFAYASCNYYGLFMTLLAPALLILLGGQIRVRSTWIKIAASIVLAGLLLAPLLMAQKTYLGRNGHERSLELVEFLSARSESYLQTPPTRLNFASLEFLGRDTVKPVFPLGMGSLAYALAGVGVAVGLARVERRRWTLFCLTLAITAYLLSLGPTWKLWGNSPYLWLAQWYPGLALLRSPHRLAMFVQLAIVCLAMEGITALAQSFAAAICRTDQRHISAAIATSVLTAAALLQTLPPRPRLFPLPDITRNSGWIDWIRNNTPAEAALLCMPLPTDPGLAAAQRSTEWMYLGLWHERPLVNGYSGFFPEHYQLVKSILTEFPQDHSRRLLLQWGVTHVVVREIGGVSNAQITALDQHLLLVHQDTTAAIRIYALTPP